MANKKDNLFESLSALCRTTRPIALQPGMKVTVEGPGGMPVQQDVLLPGSRPIVFEVHNLSGDDMIACDKFITAEAPKKIETVAEKIGTKDVHVGYDYEDPKFVRERQEQSYQREAAICILGCPALRETTPGETLEEKSRELRAKAPAATITWLAEQIDTLTIFTAVGEEDVERFLASGSTDARESSATGRRSQAKGKGASNNGKTPRTSATKKTKPRSNGK